MLARAGVQVVARSPDLATSPTGGLQSRPQVETCGQAKRRDDAPGMTGVPGIPPSRLKRVGVNLRDLEKPLAVGKKQLLARMDGTCSLEVHPLTVDYLLEVWIS